MRVLVIQGHPDPAGGHFGHALAAAFTESAQAAGHDVRTLEVTRLDFPLVRSAAEWQEAQPPAAIAEAQAAMKWAEHYFIVFPLWLGDMPALLKGFFEQVLRPRFAFDESRKGRLPKKLLKGRGARIVVTMGMPAFFYRVYYRSHSVKNLKRNILEFCGVSPVRTTLVGMVEGKGSARDKHLAAMARLGRSLA